MFYSNSISVYSLWWPWLDSEENILLLTWSPGSGGDEHKKQRNEKANQIAQHTRECTLYNQLDYNNSHWKK